MIINSIKIKNYGIYYKENTYNLTTDNPEKNITLIYGKNGSGKTTLLEAIKKAFYGCAFLGLKNPNKIYYENIKKRFNIKAFAEGERESFVEINFSWKENNNIDNYLFRRRWILEEDPNSEIIVNEFIDIYKNNVFLSKKEIENTENYFRTVFPQKLFDFFFFDGEDVKRLISTEYIEQELKESIFTLFNIDIFKSLNMDLVSYIKNRNKTKDLSELESNLLQQEEEKSLEKLKLNDLKISLEELNFKIDNIKSEIKMKNDRFKNIGGELYNQKSSIEKSVAELEFLRQKNTENMKTTLLNDISLYLNKDLLNKGLEQILKEEETKEYKILLKKIEDNSLHSLFGENFKKNITQNDLLDFASNIKTKLKENGSFIHNLPNEQIGKVTDKIQNLNNIKISVEESIKERKVSHEKLNELKAKLSILNSNKEFEDLLIEIESLNNNLQQEILKISSLENQIINISNILENMENNIQVLKKKIIEDRKNHNKFAVVNKIQTVLNKYIKIKNEEKISLVKEYFIEIFNSLHRKQGFITNIEVNSDTLEIKLFNHFGEIKNELLSAGEKQIYILSLLGAFLKASGKDIPLILDTLLGRLDEEHRENIIRYYLPSISKQILILSTDSEVTKENYVLLQPFVNKEYILNYNHDTQAVDLIGKQRGLF